MTTESEELPPDLPPPLPPRLPSAGPKPGSGRHTTPVIAAAVATPISAVLGVAVVFGATHVVNYLTVNGLLGSLFGLSVALWPIAGVLFAVAANEKSPQQSGKVLAAFGAGIVLLPAMTVVREFISAHLSCTSPVWYGEYDGLMHVAQAVAACSWDLFGMLIAYILVAGDNAKSLSASGRT